MVRSVINVKNGYVMEQVWQDIRRENNVINVQNGYVMEQVWQNIRRENMKLLVKKVIRKNKWKFM